MSTRYGAVTFETLERDNINIDTQRLSTSPCRYESLDDFKRDGRFLRARSCGRVFSLHSLLQRIIGVLFFLGISRMALVARGITAGIGMCKGIEMMQVSTRQHRPITLLILSLVASSNRVCVSSVISAVFATAQVSQIVTPHKQTQRKTLPRVSIQRTLREISKFRYQITTLILFMHSAGSYL